MAIYIQEEWVNRSEGYRTGSSEVYETFTDDKGKLYRCLIREYGRCIGKVYVDTNGKTREIGWVFLKRAKYEDSNETFLLETWVTLHTEPPTRSIEYHYLNAA